MALNGSRKREFLFIALGSAGDVMPALGIAGCLAARGHRVRLVGSRRFSKVAGRAGIEHLAIETDEQEAGSACDIPLLGTRYRNLFVRRHAVRWNLALLPILRRMQAGGSLVVSMERPLLWADLVAHAHFGMDAIRMLVDLPPAPRAGVRVPELPGGRVQGLLDQAAHAVWAAGASRFGLFSGRNFFSRLGFATSRSVPRVALWPEWIAPGVLPGLAKFGFIEPPPLGVDAPPARKAASLKGLKLVVFIAGSTGTTSRWEEQFCRVSMQACVELGCSGLLLGGGNAAAWIQDSNFFEWRAFEPLEGVLPIAAAIVHHGGIGTAAAALRHAVPQVMVPRLFSQPSNAEWFRRLGVGRVLQPEEYHPGRVAQVLGKVTENGFCREACARWSVQHRPEFNVLKAADFLEGWKGMPFHRTSRNRPRSAALQFAT